VNRPEFEMVPAVAVQVTDVFELPLTVAVNCRVAPVCTEVEVGEIETVTPDVEAVTLTVADADLLGSATLVARTV
jgi:hypothetical protein